MQNFKKETLESVSEAGKTPEEIVFIGSEDYEYGCTWGEFLELSDFLYDSSYGTAMIPSDLVIRFSDGSYLERGEYDGSEWWQHVQFRKNPGVEPKKITALTSRNYFLNNTVAKMTEENK